MELLTFTDVFFFFFWPESIREVKAKLDLDYLPSKRQKKRVTMERMITFQSEMNGLAIERNGCVKGLSHQRLMNSSSVVK